MLKALTVSHWKTRSHRREFTAAQQLKPLCQRKTHFIGTVFADRYKVLEFLGKGGMGHVYKVENLIARRFCEEAKLANQSAKVIDELEERCFRALKIMNADCAADPTTVFRFETETEAICRVKNENVIQIIDTGKTEDGRPWFTMPFLDGQSLSQLCSMLHIVLAPFIETSNQRI